MIDNPYEPKPAPPFEAGPRVLARRGNAYSLPPIGDARSRDRRHLRRQGWIGTAMVLLLILLPFGWWFGSIFGLWTLR
jgi:hypothetical protein